MTVDVLLIGASPSVAEAVKLATRPVDGIAVDSVADAATGVRVASDHPPDVMVIDLELVEVGRHDLLQVLRGHAPDAAVVLCGDDEADDPDTPLAPHVEQLVAVLRGLLGGWHVCAEVALPVAPISVRRAREFARGLCGDWGCDEIGDAVELVVSELVTNALLHLSSPCQLRMKATSRSVRVEVWDPEPSGPMPSPIDPDSDNGRGLALVGAVSRCWGVAPEPPGKVVWAEFGFG